jgi:hypothetical protein
MLKSSCYYSGTVYDYVNVSFTISANETYGSYTDCVRIDYDATSSSVDAYYRGTGYYYMARDVAVVYHYFIHYIL